MRARTRLLIAGGIVAAALPAALFGPVVRSLADKGAARHGAALTVESVRPSWSGVRLSGVRVDVTAVPSAAIRLDAVTVAWPWLFRDGEVTVAGGSVALRGEREEILRQGERWRLARGGDEERAGSAGGGARVRPLRVEGLGLDWEEPTGGRLHVAGVRLHRTAQEIRAGASRVTARRPAERVEASDVALDLVREAGRWRVRRAVARSLEAHVELPADGAAPAAELAPAVGPPANGGGGPLRPVALGPPAPSGVTAGEGARDDLVRLARAIDEALAEGASLELAGVHALVSRGADSFHVGPGRLVVRRGPGRIDLDLSPEPAGAEQALTFRLSVPVLTGEIAADVHGGPISLAALGLREGDLGLIEVGKARLETHASLTLSADGRALTFRGEGKVQGLSLHSARLSDEPVRGLEVAWRGAGEAALDGSRLRIEGGEIDLAALRIVGGGELVREGGEARLDLKVELPLSACQSLLQSIPHGLVPRLKGFRLAGSFGLKLAARVDTARLEQMRLDGEVSNSCRVVEVPPDIAVARFAAPFRRTVRDAEGRPLETEVGPNTATWVPYEAISRFLEPAVMTTEDASFQKHAGFDAEAIKNSIRENLRAGKFVRGASTISMQLAKNLYLDRSKQLARKLQEAVLTLYLEQALTKRELMELYLNVVEFAPGVYGIGPAAWHYFRTDAGALSLSQALYLASILPNPKVQHFGAGGAVTPGWTGYLRKLMHLMAKRQRITEEELAEGLLETVVFGSPTPHRAPEAPRGAGEVALDGQAGGEPGEERARP